MSRHGRYAVWTGAFVAVAMVGMLAAGVTYAQQQQQQQQQRGERQRPAWGGRGMGMRGQAMAGLGIPLRQLNLTDDQKQQVQTIVSSHRDEFKALADRALPARQALQAAIASGDEAAIRQRTADLSTVQADRAVLQSKVHAEVFKVLTPDQQKKAQALLQQFQERRLHRGQGSF